MVSGKAAAGSVWYYAPNKVGPIVFAVAFALSGAIHIFQCIRYKSFRVTALIPVTCVMFVGGYAVREVGAYHDGNVGIYIASQFMIYMAPPILELANYHILGRVMYYVPYCAPIHPGRTLTTFGIMSTLVEILNGIGVAWSLKKSDKKGINDVGEGTLKASLILQILVIACFLAVCAVFQRRCVRARVCVRQVLIPLLTMYTTSILVLIRCLYRTVENFTGSVTAGGAEGNSHLSPVLKYEWFFYVFEAIPMILFCVLWNVFYPRFFLPHSYRTYLAQDGITELEGPGNADERPFLITMFDPFGCFGGPQNKKITPFWELNGYAHMTPKAARRNSDSSTAPLQVLGRK